MSTATSSSTPKDGLRERTVLSAFQEPASSVEGSGQDTPQTEDEADKEKKTFGRTPDGTSELEITLNLTYRIQH
jgi:phosphatidylethanolamine N-methyltransferase